MRKREKDCLDTLLGKERVLFSENVRFELGVGSGLVETRLVSTQSRLFVCRSTPMGCQLSVVWYKDVERLTSGKRKGHPYVQLLGAESRVLIVFESKCMRDDFKERCLKGIAR